MGQVGGLLKLLNECYGIGCNALAATRETELLGGGGLDGNDANLHAHNLRKASPHRVNVGAQFGSLKGNGNIHITNPISLASQNLYGALQKDAGVDTLIGHIVVGEVFADVACGNGSEQRITQGVDSYVAVRVGNTTEGGVNLDTTNYKRKPLGENVNVVSKTYAHTLILC